MGDVTDRIPSTTPHPCLSHVTCRGFCQISNRLQPYLGAAWHSHHSCWGCLPKPKKTKTSFHYRIPKAKTKAPLHWELLEARDESRETRVERPLLGVNLSRFSCHFCNFFNNIFVFRFHSPKRQQQQPIAKLTAEIAYKWNSYPNGGLELATWNWALLWLRFVNEVVKIRDKGHLRIEEKTVGAKALSGTSKDWRELKTRRRGLPSRVTYFESSNTPKCRSSNVSIIFKAKTSIVSIISHNNI